VVIVAFGGRGQAVEDILRIIAPLDKASTRRINLTHVIAGALVEHRWVRRITSHVGVVLVLDVRVRQAIANQQGLNVDVYESGGILLYQRRGEFALVIVVNDLCDRGDIVTSVGFASNVKLELLVSRKPFEKELEEGINVLGGSQRVAGGAPTIGVTDVQGLIQKDDASIGVPRVGIQKSVGTLVIDLARAEFHQQASERRTAGAAIEPDDEGISFRVGTRFKKPKEKMLVVINVKIASNLFDVRVTELGLPVPNRVLWKCREGKDVDPVTGGRGGSQDSLVLPVVGEFCDSPHSASA